MSWAHPKFGTLLASSSYDSRIIVWRESPPNTWSKIYDFAQHGASVNLVAWAPHESGCVLAGASTDGQVSVLELKGNEWVSQLIPAHGLGVNAVSWAPSVSPGAVAGASGQGQQQGAPLRRFVTGGSDCNVKIWDFSSDTQTYTCAAELTGHSDWVRDVSWAPSILSKSYIASASQDKTVRIWTTSVANPTAGKSTSPLRTPSQLVMLTKFKNTADWTSTTLPFDAVAWRCSWSLSGNVLAVSTGDNKVSLWKERLAGGWEKIKDMDN